MIRLLKKIEHTIDRVVAKDWHSFDVDRVLSEINTTNDGLTSAEALDRLKIFGTNELPKKESQPAWKLFLHQFNSPLMYIMMVAIGISLYIDNVSDAIFIIVVVASNACVGFYQEHKANKSLEALQQFVKLKTRVMRGGREQEVFVTHIVPGDIIILRAGDKIPADGRIIECSNVRVNESSLTGESKPVQKSSQSVSAHVPIGDRSSMVFMGTIVEEGSLRIVVVETGTRTQYGDIVEMLEETQEEPTPLQRTVVSLSKIVGIFITLVVGIIILEGYIKNQPTDEIFAVALALFVSAIPEGLLPAITIVLTLGMRRIMKHKGLVRRLAATETLGGVTVICTDKTGTLTEGKMAVSSVIVAEKDAPSEALIMPLQIALFSSDAYIENPDAPPEKVIIRGRSTEQAVLRAGVMQGLRKDVLDREYTTLDTIFFSSEQKYSASLRRTPSGEHMLYVIGAPERILDRTKAVNTAHGVVGTVSEEYKSLVARMEELTIQGFRLIACAYRAMPNPVTHSNLNLEVKELTLSGFIVLNDPVRPDVKAAFEKTKRAGIRTVIITGDHRSTAQAVADKIGFSIDSSAIIEGHDIENLNDDELKEKTKSILLYARVSPRHKLRIIKSFQEQGEIVAMFGDGVNDAPALKASNIGVAVNTEVDAAREVADIVLLDGGFGTIVKAIEQGRIIFDNIRRVFLYLITQDFSQFFIFLVSIAVGLPLPLVAAQLLMVNLVESGLPDIALTTEEEKEGVMDMPPRDPKESILNKTATKFMFSVFAVSGIIAICFYYITLNLVGDLDTTRTMLMVFLSMEALFLSLSVRSFRKPIIRKDIFSNKWLTGAILISFGMVLVAVYFGPIQNVLSTVSLSIGLWVVIFLVNILEILLIDGCKRVFFR